MDITGSPDIFQARMSEILVVLDCVRAYIDVLLCITKACHSDHLNKLKMVYTRLQEVGLQVNTRKFSSVSLEWNTLGISSGALELNPSQRK
jgi:hypothetical protein